MGPMRRWLTAWLVLLTAGTALGQEDPLRQIQRGLETADDRYHVGASPDMTLMERARIEYGGWLRFGFLATDDIRQETHILRRTEATAFTRITLDGGHEFFGRLRYDYLDFNSGDSFVGRGDRYVYPLADRYWYKFDLRKAVGASEWKRLGWDLDLKVGRQYVDWASGLVLSDELYAAQGTLDLDPFELTGLAALTPSSTFVDFDASRRDFHDDTHRFFGGGRVTFTGLADHKPYFYAIHQEDMNGSERAPVRPLGTPTRFDYDSTYFALGSTGQLVPHLQYTAEAIFERGEGLSDSLRGPQSREDIEAWAGNFQLSYLFRDDNRSRVELETIVASGDDDRGLDTSNTFGGNAPGTDDEAFNGFGFAKTGLAFNAPVSNLVSVRMGGSTFPLRERRPFRRLRVGADVLFFNKFDSDAPTDEPTSSHHGLGFETDFFVDWRITSDVSWNARYGIFFPGRAIRAEKDPRHFLYTGITYAF